MIKINADIGEGFGCWKANDDEKIIPYLDYANIACGFHASDPDIMSRCVFLCKKYNVIIGAHPSFNDKLGFGRRLIPHSIHQIKNLCIYQIGALSYICNFHQTKCSFVKPHGALYHLMMEDLSVFIALIETIKGIDSNLKLMILSGNNNDKYLKIADSFGIQLLFESFIDRTYLNNGNLKSRSQENAVITDVDIMKQQYRNLSDGFVMSDNSRKLTVNSQTACLHSDNPNALNFLKSLKKHNL